MTATPLSDRLFDDDDTAPIDPFALFEEWFAEARASEPNDPHAMALATVDAAGMPDTRMVLMNAHDNRGFVFLHQSRKPQGRGAGRQRRAPPWCFTGNRCAARSAPAVRSSG